MKKKGKSLKQSRWVDYLLSFSLAFLIMVILGFVYIEDVQEGLGVIARQVVDAVVPDLMM